MKFEYVKRFFVIRINRSFDAYRFEFCIPNIFGFSAIRTSKKADYIKFFTGGKEERIVPYFCFGFYAIRAFKNWIATRGYNPEVEEVGGKTFEAYIRDQREKKMEEEFAR